MKHLHSLSVKNFKCLEDFQIEKLGDVNLIVGGNNSGKSTVLEAVRVYASCAAEDLLRELSDLHEESDAIVRDDTNETNLEEPYSHFFTGRCFPELDGKAITIGEIDKIEEVVSIEHVWFQRTEEIFEESSGAKSRRVQSTKIDKQALSLIENGALDIEPMLVVKKGTKDYSLLGFRAMSRVLFSSRRLELRVMNKSLTLAVIANELVPTDIVSSDELARIWDKIDLTGDEILVHDALKIICSEYEGIKFVEKNRSRDSSRRTALVKLATFASPVPMSSMGDGMWRILQIILKMLNAKNGFLLIDEIENGLHYSVQDKVWTMLFDLAKQFNIQIFATTHSWDTVESFKRVAVENEKAEGMLIRVGKSAKKGDNGKIISVVYDEESFPVLDQMHLEVR